MLNFPVAAGTSGHLLGGALAAILVGPYTGVLCVSVVLLMQGVLFADGGLTALGVNITRHGRGRPSSSPTASSAGCCGSCRARRGSVTGAAFAAALVSVPAAAVAFTGLYALGGTADVALGKVFAAMVGVHVLIGIGEAAITAPTVGAVARRTPRPRPRRARTAAPPRAALTCTAAAPATGAPAPERRQPVRGRPAEATAPGGGRRAGAPRSVRPRVAGRARRHAAVRGRRQLLRLRRSRRAGEGRRRQRHRREGRGPRRRGLPARRLRRRGHRRRPPVRRPRRRHRRRRDPRRRHAASSWPSAAPPRRRRAHAPRPAPAQTARRARERDVRPGRAHGADRGTV